MSDYTEDEYDDYIDEDGDLDYAYGKFAPCPNCGSSDEICLCAGNYDDAFDDMDGGEDEEDDGERVLLADDPVVFYAGVDDEMPLGEDVLETMRKHVGVELMEPMDWLERYKSPAKYDERSEWENQYIQKWVQRKMEHERYHNQPMSREGKLEYSLVPVEPGETDPEVLRRVIENLSPECKFEVYVMDATGRRVDGDPGDECECGCQDGE